MAARRSKGIKPDPSSPVSSSSSPTRRQHTRQRRPSASPAMAVSVNTSAAGLSAPTGSIIGAPRMLTPPPQSAHSELAGRMGDVALTSPVVERNSSRRGERHQLPPPPGKGPRTGSVFFAENRAILLSGLPQSPASHESTSPPQQPVRNAGSPQKQQRRDLTPIVTVYPPAPHSHLCQQHTQYYDHPQSAALGPHASPYSPLQSPRTFSHVVRVKAVPFGHRPRRDSVSSTRATENHDEKARTRMAAKDTALTEAAEAVEFKREAGLTPPPEGQLKVSAFIVPRAGDKTRKMIHLKRDFDLQALLDAVPRPPPESSVDRRYRSSISILASPVVASALSPSFPPPRSPLSARPTASTNEQRSPLPGPPPPTPVTAGPNYVTGMKRPASDYSPNTPATPHPNLRRQTAEAKHSRQSSQASPRELPAADQVLADGSVLIPIRESHVPFCVLFFSFVCPNRT